MNAVKFEWLNRVCELEINSNFLLVNLYNINQYGEVEAITAKCELDSKTVDAHIQGNPEKCFDLKIKCLKSKLAIVTEFNNIHAIENMPFRLTGDQFNTINSYLEDMPL